ncbi:sulfatase family protein [Posidoniimonas corsicana]|uniref:sulfatase family protein n=1 Tax=Posidoniimonas corsicana TaxID=1938618 RepID=UPI001E477B2E|nr:sulfatase [Posidoniimonas corsicana]
MGASSAAVGAGAGSLASDRPPNFVIIFTDDQGYGDVGCFGSPDIRTPRLDAMADAGLRLTSFYAQPICGPSRAALMTGCYPMRVAERGNTKQVHPILHLEEVTIAEVLKTREYATACFGKWDLANHSQTDFYADLLPTSQGFDEFFGTPSSNDRAVNLYRNDELIEPNAPMATLTERYTDEAIRFMQRHSDQPFFVYLAHTMPHTRLAASPHFKGKSKRGLYGDVIEELDSNIGRVLDAVDDMGLAQDTYVIFTSDNGPWLSKNRGFANGHRLNDHGGSAGPLRSGKVSTFEGGVRVPCIVWGPGRVPSGKSSDAVASTLDMLPTLAALAGAKTPSDRVIDGQDIRHLFHGEFDRADPDKAFFYYLRVHLQAVRQGRWKLHLPRDAEPTGAAPFSLNKHIASGDRIGFDSPFLVDLKHDLGETTNVAGEHPGVTRRLLALAQAMRDDLGDYDHVGEHMRFYDLDGPRPTRPPLPPEPSN